jgi:hypothetical protein
MSCCLHNLYKDSLACGLFFATFEWVKQQGYYYFLDEVYGYQIDSSEALTRVDSSWNHTGFLNKHDEEDDEQPIEPAALSAAAPDEPIKEKTPLLLEPIFVITAGAFAAVVRPNNIEIWAMLTNYLLISRTHNFRYIGLSSY